MSLSAHHPLAPSGRLSGYAVTLYCMLLIAAGLSVFTCGCEGWESICVWAVAALAVTVGTGALWQARRRGRRKLKTYICDRIDAKQPSLDDAAVRSEVLLRALGRMDIGLLICDERMKIRVVGGGFAETLGYLPAELTDRSLGMLVSGDGAGCTLRGYRDLILKGEQALTRTVPLTRKDGAAANLVLSMNRMLFGGKWYGVAVLVPEKLITSACKLKQDRKSAAPNGS